jgi:hypothetical protein
VTLDAFTRLLLFACLKPLFKHVSSHSQPKDPGDAEERDDETHADPDQYNPEL